MSLVLFAGKDRKVLYRSVAVLGPFLVALTAWALATPVGSSPDDDFHLATIYCIAGESPCRSQGSPDVNRDLAVYDDYRKLPCFVMNGTSGYAPDARVPADCLSAEDPTANTPMTIEVLDHYPSVYYRFMSLITHDSFRESVVNWRMINVLLALAVAAMSLLLSRPEHKVPAAIAWLVSSVPFGLFLVTSINPSAWAVVGTAAIIGPAISVVSRKWWSRRSGFQIAFVVACAVMAAGSRTEGIGLVAIALSVALVLGAGSLRQRKSQITLALGVFLLAAASFVAVALSAKLRNFLATGLGNLTADTASQPVGLWDAVLSVPSLYAQAHSPLLGWLEIDMPAVVGILGGAAFFGAGFFGLSVFYRRKLIALLLLATVLLFAPAVILLNGQYLQARYVLPLVYVVAFVLLAPPIGKVLPEMGRAQKGALVLALSAANSLALLQTTVRYVSGLTTGATNPGTFLAHPVPDWWWDYWLSPFANWVLGSMAFILGCYLLLRNPGPLYPRFERPQTVLATKVEVDGREAAAGDTPATSTMGP